MLGKINQYDLTFKDHGGINFTNDAGRACKLSLIEDQNIQMSTLHTTITRGE